MDSKKKLELQKTACKVRMGVIEGTFNAKSGHPGGSLSITDVLTYLYFSEMNIDPKNPAKPDRDRLVLSKGHCAPGLYSVLANRGYFPVEELKRLRKPHEILQGHPDMKSAPGVDMTTGSLGQGISAACGMALSAKLSGESYRVYAILGDGELEEGQVWEASMFAAHRKLDNLCVIVDNNNLQIDGAITEVCSPYPIPEKFAAFGFHVIEINGNCFDDIEKAVSEAKTITGKPTAIICKSVKGKGVSFMENNVDWHGTAPNAEQYEQAMGELKAALAALENA
ncbi:transketolase [Acetanaerobacterium elongatum]|uniref:Transketolase n=1 Tax=Acetanaerobacterium elongatum TaxID=258515 RepID=A0A1G9X1P8_9FIRM|nr:transketolase [Acetanaerobacterium elongatum]SDM90628.1 transketolase [Acetanaerobacterium elongatum]